MRRFSIESDRQTVITAAFVHKRDSDSLLMLWEHKNRKRVGSVQMHCVGAAKKILQSIANFLIATNDLPISAMGCFD